MTSFRGKTVPINSKFWCRTRVSNPSSSACEVEAMSYQGDNFHAIECRIIMCDTFKIIETYGKQIGINFVLVFHVIRGILA